jgi:hypothetical protein
MLVEAKEGSDDIESICLGLQNLASALVISTPLDKANVAA